jgi:hypothetical protein
MSNNIEWVVRVTMKDGSTYRGIQKAWYGHPAMDFFRKRLGLVDYQACSAEKLDSFNYFLSQGLRTPLTAEELAL